MVELSSSERMVNLCSRLESDLVGSRGGESARSYDKNHLNGNLWPFKPIREAECVFSNPRCPYILCLYAVAPVKISESPASNTAIVEHLKSFPQAVPSSICRYALA